MNDKRYKMKRTSLFLVMLGVMVTEESWACAVCLGGTEGSVSAGLQSGVICLLVVTCAVLAGFGCFFLKLARRVRLHIPPDIHGAEP